MNNKDIDNVVINFSDGTSTTLYYSTTAPALEVVDVPLDTPVELEATPITAPAPTPEPITTPEIV